MFTGKRCLRTEAGRSVLRVDAGDAPGRWRESSRESRTAFHFAVTISISVIRTRFSLSVVAIHPILGLRVRISVIYESGCRFFTTGRSAGVFCPGGVREDRERCGSRRTRTCAHRVGRCSSTGCRELGAGMLPRDDVTDDIRSGSGVVRSTVRASAPCRATGLPPSSFVRRTPPLPTLPIRCCRFAVYAYGSADVPAGRWRGRFRRRSEDSLRRTAGPPESRPCRVHTARSRRRGHRVGTPGDCCLAADFVVESSAEARGSPPEWSRRIALCVPPCGGDAGGAFRPLSRKGLTRLIGP